MGDRSGERRAMVRGAGGWSLALLVAVAALAALVSATGSLATYEDLDTLTSHSAFHSPYDPGAAVVHACPAAGSHPWSMAASADGAT
jgi:hypothetical protein